MSDKTSEGFKLESRLAAILCCPCCQTEVSRDLRLTYIHLLNAYKNVTCIAMNNLRIGEKSYMELYNLYKDSCPLIG